MDTPSEPTEPTGPSKPSDEDTLATFGEKLQLYRKALEEEYDLIKNPDLADPEKLAEKARNDLVLIIPKAISTLSELVEYGDSHNVRFQAAKYVAELTIGKNGTHDPGDPMERLLKDLAKNDPKVEQGN